jgi:hypothetical protein
MEPNDFSSFMEKNEDGSIKSLDEGKMQSYIDSLISKGVNAGVESYKAKQAEAERISKMTADEQMALRQKEFDDKVAQWEATVRSQKRDLVVEKAKTRLEPLFSAKEIELLSKNISDDEKESLKYVDLLVAERTKFVEEKTKSIKEELQSKQPVSSSQSNTQDEEPNQKVAKRTQQDIKNMYK